MIWSKRRFRGVVVGDEPADRNARKVVQQRQHRIEYWTADILEIDIDALRTSRFQIFAQPGLAMIEARVESELVPNEAALLSASGNADNPAALDLCDLADHRADSTRGRSDDTGLSGVGFSDIQKARIGGETLQDEHAPCVAKPGGGSVDLLVDLPL